MSEASLNSPLVVAGIYGDRLFAEVVSPLVVLEDADRLGVLGYVSRLQWPGWDVGGRRPSARFGVYERRTLRRIMAFEHHGSAYVGAFHPSLPLLALGRGTFDGDFYEGELLLANLVSGRLVSAFEGTRYVGNLEWVDDRVLRVVTAPHDAEGDESQFGGEYVATVECGDWLGIVDGELGEPVEDVVGTRALRDREEQERGGILGPRTRARLAGIAAEVGSSWELRGEVWAVELLPDGRVLAAGEGTTLECRLPSGELQWAVRSEFGARQIRVAADGKSAWALLCPQPRWDGQYVTHPDTALERRSIEDGSLVEVVALDVPRVMTSRADGLIALRDTRHDVDGTPLLLIAPDGARRDGAGMTAHSLFGTYLSPRHCPDILFVRNAEDATGSWVCRYDDASDSYRDLFPLKVAADRPWTSGGPAAYAETAEGPILVVSGSESGRYGVEDGGFVVSARNYPTGEVRWISRADEVVVAVDCVGEVAYVAYASGEFAALDVTSGNVLWRHTLLVDDCPVQPLSMVVSRDGGRIVVGLVDGRVVACSV
ncbi:outer membrane protein assembly factor BamB family protein [Yinghuangia sp. YIM S09857]|uniref:outer membrane protein assembly factor BamB family protein n=1 Tax=Yinghuangia sp. YIM S09857 TaxID=3436929 RepID=UPI003F53B868